MLLAESGEQSGAAAPAANALVAALDRGATPAFLLNDGPIGAPDGEPGAIRLDRKEANELLGAAMSDQLAWEIDPDFGYELPLATPSLTGGRELALAPRMAFAANGTVYQHAELVPRLKEERHAILAAVPGLDPAIVAASGWPVEPTGSSWRGRPGGSQ